MRRSFLAFCCALLPLAPASAVTVGQIDTFEDGTVQNWVVNLLGMGPHPAPPVNVATDGPAGANDHFMRLTSVGGAGSGSRMTVINLAQWSGDYVAAGVQAISMSVRNPGASDLNLRLFFEDPMGGPPTNTAFSTDSILVQAGNEWQTVIFGVRPGDLSPGTGSVLDALTNATAFRIYPAAAPGFPGEPIVALLDVDNIQALAAVPEPATWAMMIAGFGLAGAAMRRRSRLVTA